MGGSGGSSDGLIFKPSIAATLANDGLIGKPRHADYHRDVSVPRIDPTALPGRPCGLASGLELVGDRWSLLVVREVFFGNHRFSQIARNTGAPRDRLTARLKDLVEAGVLERRANPDNPRHEGYYLTEAGAELGPAVLMLMAWGDKWAVTDPPMRQTHVDHPMVAAMMCATCGEPVDDHDVSREMAVSGWDMTGRVTRPAESDDAAHGHTHAHE
jgi:DNA-binding HxlR family transcriptional regulator